MVQLLTAQNCDTTKRLQQKLKKLGIPYTIRFLSHQPLTFSEFKQILFLTENGITEIINKGSYTYRHLKKNGKFEDMKLSELHTWVCMNPDIIKTPLLVDFQRDKLVSYLDETNISILIPREKKMKSYREILEKMHALFPATEGVEECITL